MASSSPSALPSAGRRSCSRRAALVGLGFSDRAGFGSASLSSSLSTARRSKSAAKRSASMSSSAFFSSRRAISASRRACSSSACFSRAGRLGFLGETVALGLLALGFFGQTLGLGLFFFFGARVYLLRPCGQHPSAASFASASFGEPLGLGFLGRCLRGEALAFSLLAGVLRLRRLASASRLASSA